MDKNNKLTTEKVTGEPSLLIPVYSKWKPAADTLMSDWKVRNKLLDVLFSSWGIVVPVIYIIKDTVTTVSTMNYICKPIKNMLTLMHQTYITFITCDERLWGFQQQ